jgi:hypothetical protein
VTALVCKLLFIYFYLFIYASPHNWDDRYAPLHQLLLAEMAYHKLPWAGLKLWFSSLLPISASQEARITGLSHHTWLIPTLLKRLGSTEKRVHQGRKSASQFTRGKGRCKMR